MIGYYSIMPLRTTLNISLRPELEQFVQQRVASGRYQTASEVVREGLRLLEQQERDRQVAFKELKAKLRRGAAQAKRGEVVDPDEVLQKIGRLAQQRQLRILKAHLQHRAALAEKGQVVSARKVREEIDELKRQRTKTKR